MYPTTIVLAGSETRVWEPVLQAIHRTADDAEVLVVHDGEAVVDLFVHDHGRRKQNRFRKANRYEPASIGLLLLDLDLPKLDGFRVLRQLRWLQRTDLSTLPPIVILSDRVDGDLISAAFRYGASGFLCTSVDSRQFAENVAQTLRYWLSATLRPPTHHDQRLVRLAHHAPSMLPAQESTRT